MRHVGDARRQCSRQGKIRRAQDGGQVCVAGGQVVASEWLWGCCGMATARAATCRNPLISKPVAARTSPHAPMLRGHPCSSEWNSCRGASNACQCLSMPVNACPRVQSGRCFPPDVTAFHHKCRSSRSYRALRGKAPPSTTTTATTSPILLLTYTWFAWEIPISLPARAVLTYLPLLLSLILARRFL